MKRFIIRCYAERKINLIITSKFLFLLCAFGVRFHLKKNGVKTYLKKS